MDKVLKKRHIHQKELFEEKHIEAFELVALYHQISMRLEKYIFVLVKRFRIIIY